MTQSVHVTGGFLIIDLNGKTFPKLFQLENFPYSIHVIVVFLSTNLSNKKINHSWIMWSIDLLPWILVGFG